MTMFTHIPAERFAAVYNTQYNQSNIRKFLFRKGNHWAEKLRRLFALTALLDIRGKRMLDLGCSVGTLSIEFAGRGWETTGVDLDPGSIEVAKALAAHLGTSVDYRVGDISNAALFPEDSFDLIVAGDIVEHLPDEVLDHSLANVRRWLKPGGFFVFHTVPTRLDYIFHKSGLWVGLAPFAALPDRYFSRLAALYDRLARSIPGLVREDPVSTTIHCNLQDAAGFRRRIAAAGLDLISLEADTFEARFRRPSLKTWLFGAKTVYKKNLIGAAWKTLFESPTHAAN